MKTLIIVIACLLLSTNSFADKGGIHVYDAGDQYLGVYLGMNGGTFDIFVPAANSVLRLDKTRGTNRNGSQTLYYTLPNCEGDAYMASASGALLYHNYFDPIYKYFSAPPISGGITVAVQSQRSKSYPANCEDWFGDLDNLVEVQHYTEEDVGITFPLTLPLRFEYKK